MTKKPPHIPPEPPVCAPVANPDTARLMSEMRQRIEVLEVQIAALKLYLAAFIVTPVPPPMDPGDDGAGDAER